MGLKLPELLILLPLLYLDCRSVLPCHALERTIFSSYIATIFRSLPEPAFQVSSRLGLEGGSREGHGTLTRVSGHPSQPDESNSSLVSRPLGTYRGCRWRILEGGGSTHTAMGVIIHTGYIPIMAALRSPMLTITLTQTQ